MTHSSRHDDFGDRGHRSDDEEYTPRVAALSKIDGFDVADGTPDPRGWTVRDASGTDIGKVHDLIVDTVAMRTRYLDVELDKKALHLDKDRDVLIPVGQARLDDDDDRVILGSMSASRLALLPEYTHGDIDRQYESSLLPNFDEGAVDATNGGDSGAAIGAMSGQRPDSRSGVIADAPESDFYDNRHFDEKSFFGTRRVQQQREEERPPRSEPAPVVNTRSEPQDTSIRKRTDARRAAEPATESRDEVTVERHPIANADMAAGSAIGDDEIRIPVYEDEIVVEKRRVLKEELVVKKSAVPDAQSAAGIPRKDKIDGGETDPRNQSPADERR
jgi:photosynthetic reaction center H subunit